MEVRDYIIISHLTLLKTLWNNHQSFLVVLTEIGKSIFEVFYKEMLPDGVTPKKALGLLMKIHSAYNEEDTIVQKSFLEKHFQSKTTLPQLRTRSPEAREDWPAALHDQPTLEAKKCRRSKNRV